jgi:catechol 2,3-dioxygenase
MEVKELGHVVLYVRDIRRSVRFYRDILGWRQILPVPAERETARFAAFSSASNRTHHELLLIEVGPNAASQPPAPRVGLYHIGVKIGDADDDLREAVTRLEMYGVPIKGASDHTTAHSLYISDPDGNEVELYIDVADLDWRNDPSLLTAQARPLHL